MLGLACGFAKPLESGQYSVRKELDRVDWQPTWTVPGARYVGKEACAQCHSHEVATQEASAMAQALCSPTDSLVLKAHPTLTFIDGPYHYTVERRTDGTFYAVTDGTSTIALPLLWSFGYGIGQVAQTYLVFYSGSYYEGRVSFFNALQGLDVTLGHSSRVPTFLPEALGRMVKPEEVRACFGCHSTGAVSDGRLELDKLIPGITCEGCHGPGAEHVAAVQAGKLQQPRIFNPASLAPGDLVKFCGACHRTRAHVEALQLKGTTTVRFQPYRLTESSCFSTRDRRISCIACHDPHRNPEHEPAFYDSKCLACHGSGGTSVPPVESHGRELILGKDSVSLRSALGMRRREVLWSAAACCRFDPASLLADSLPESLQIAARTALLAAEGGSKLPHSKAATCPVASSRCVTCHMPKYELAGSHFKFTDHKIRVVRLGDTFD